MTTHGYYVIIWYRKNHLRLTTHTDNTTHAPVASTLEHITPAPENDQVLEDTSTGAERLEMFLSHRPSGKYLAVAASLAERRLGWDLVYEPVT